MAKEEKQKEAKAKAKTDEPKATEPAPAENGNAELAALKAELERAKAELRTAKEAEQAVRGNSEKLLSEKRDAETKLRDLGDYDKIKKILSAVGDVEEAELHAEGKHEEVYASRHQKFLSDVHEPIITERDSWKSKYEELKASYDDKAKTDPLQEAWLKSHGKPEMFKYAVGDGKAKFSFTEDGSLVPRDASGNIIYGPGGTDPMTPEQWAAGFLHNEPDFKIPSQGTSAKGSGSGGTINTSINPWSPAYKGGDKATLKMKYLKELPEAEIKRMKREAGIF